jgi:hypothetical protein
VVGANLFRNLAGAKPGEQFRDGLTESRAFPRHLGSDQYEKNDDDREQRRVDDGNGPSAPLEQSLQVGNRREKDRKQKGDERGTGDVEKPQAQGKQQHRNQNPRRT